MLLISEVDVALEALTKLPVRRNNVESCFDSSIAELNFERKRLTIKVSVALIICSPISWHCLPFVGFRSFDPNFRNLTSSCNVWDENKLEIVSTVYCKSHPSASSASNSIVKNGDDSSFVLSDGEKRRLSHVEVRSWWITPSSIVACLSKVWWTEVCGCDCDWCAF